VDDGFEYVFPAIRGVQAGQEFYVSQCPLRLIPRLFLFDDPDLPADVRAQRSLNRQRLPEMARYLLDHRDSYVFSALTASVDADVRFEPVSDKDEAQRIGLLHIPMTARFIINDGQHRRAAIEMALTEEPALGDETIAVVFFLDLGLERCQQMFADLNRHAVRVSPSLGVLYDHRDATASLTRSIVAEFPLFGDLVDLERSSLANRSRKLFTLSAIHTATRALFAGRDDATVAEAVAFWEGVSEGFPEWRLVAEKKITGGDVRRDLIHTHGIVLHALGKVGNALHAEGRDDWKQVGVTLGELNWSRANSRVWEGRATIGGRVQKAGQNVTLTVNVLKKKLDLPLSADEQRAEQALKQGARRG
jgi:DNA sulfur modification protein DndB